jgi:RsiW-degrading membrane proteinase PrsW (M82 family)
MIIAISLIIALTVPVLFLFILRHYDLYKTGQFSMNIITLLCGMVAYFIAAQINTAVANTGWASWDQVIRIVAPIVEEILKSIIVIYIVSRADFNYIVDGALYGFGAGIGFAMIENIQYVTNNVEIALFVAVIRVFSTNLMHATGSGIIGTAWANTRGDKSKRAWLIIALGYLFSIIFHAVFNSMVSSGTIVLVAIAYGLLGAVLIYYIIHHGMGIQKQWVSEKLTIADRAGKQDTKAATKIEILEETLAPIKERFGQEKADKVKEYISLQAEIGIKRKLLDSDTKNTRKIEVEEIIKNLVADTDRLRNEVGVYCMMMVREVYLEQDSQTWNLLADRIAVTGTGQKGGGLWDLTKKRIQESASREDES